VALGRAADGERRRDAQALPVQAVGYIRVSSTEQARSGLGLEAQRAAIVALAKRRELELLEPIEADEGISGAKPAAKRPALARALARLRPGEALLVAQPDRLGRDVPEGIRLLGELKRLGVPLVCANGVSTEGDDEVAWLTMMLLLVLAEFTLRQGRRRTKSALAAKLARGERAGNTRFGQRADREGRLLDDEGEQRALAVIRQGVRQKHTVAQVIAELEASGIKPRRGRWHAWTVRRLMARTDRPSDAEGGGP